MGSISSRVAATVAAGAGTALLLAGGVWASSVLTVTDTTSIAVGATAASTGCTSSVEVKAGKAAFVDAVSDFAYQSVTVGTIPDNCAGMDVTVVGVSDSGTKVAQAVATAAPGTLTLNLDRAVTVGEVGAWKVIIQN